MKFLKIIHFRFRFFFKEKVLFFKLFAKIPWKFGKNPFPLPVFQNKAFLRPIFIFFGIFGQFLAPKIFCTQSMACWCSNRSVWPWSSPRAIKFQDLWLEHLFAIFLALFVFFRLFHPKYGLLELKSLGFARAFTFTFQFSRLFQGFFSYFFIDGVTFCNFFGCFFANQLFFFLSSSLPSNKR